MRVYRGSARIAAAAALLFSVAGAPAAFAQAAQNPAAAGGQQAAGQYGRELLQGPTSRAGVQGGILTLGSDNNIDPNQPIRPGFTVSVQVQSAAGPEADLSGNYLVDPAGNIQLKLAGSIGIKGLTPTQAADKVAVALRPYIKEPKVNVSIISTPKPLIILGGAVAQGGPIMVTDTTPLAEVLAVVAPTAEADLSRVVVVSTDEKGNRVTKQYNFMRWMKPPPGQIPDESQNPTLQDRDFIYVPLKNPAGLGTITVEGAVVHQGTLDARVGVPVSLREAISLSGGPLPTADRGRVSIRREGQATPIVSDYDLTEANDPSNNIMLLPGDVVYVETLGFNQFVNLNGAFTRPGKLPYTRSMTLLQAVSEAGGTAVTAKEKEGHIFRHIGGNADPTQTQIIAFNYGKVRSGKQPDIRLEPGDTVDMPIGPGPQPPLSPLIITQELLSVVYVLHILVNPNGNGVF